MRGPVDFPDLLLTPGVGARTVRSLAMVAEVVHGAPYRFRDPARFSLAHGGKFAGLGFSAMAQRFAIGSRGEAVAYLAHDVLGPRLIECTRLVMAASERTIDDILGSPDDMKFRSSMTLFDAVSKQEIFAEAIATFYPAGKDPATIEILRTLKDQPT